MIFTRTGFADPVSAKDLAPGDLITIDAGAAGWLALCLADDERGWPMAMLLAGPDLHGHRMPLPVDLRGIHGGLGRIAVERISIAPEKGAPVALPGVLQHGSLVIDGRGEVWLAYRSRSRPESQFLSLVTFEPGAPTEPTLAYPGWRMVLREGPNEHELIAFAAGRMSWCCARALE